MTCENGIEAAKADAKNGKYNYLSYGLSFDTDPELSKFVREYREQKYGISTGNAGCKISEYSKCYKKTIETIIQETFGADIFEKSYKEAEELYSKK